MKSCYVERAYGCVQACFFIAVVAMNFPARAQGIIHTYAGNGTPGYNGDNGAATSAELNLLSQIAVDAVGNLYIADTDNNVVRKVTPMGVITTIAGNGTAGFTGDGGAATSAELNWPYGVAVDATGTVYIADTVNQRVRKVSSGVISTFAGNGTAGYSGDGGAATSAELHVPVALAVDASGNVYIADANNNVIRKVAPSGTISTFAGNGTAGYTGDGGAAASAELNLPYGIATDASGNLYIADTDNNVVREVSSGTITTVAGNGTAGFSGDGGLATSAELDVPFNVTVDQAGNLFIADASNKRIREVSGGLITTIAGNGTGGFSGDGGAATSAKLNNPYSVAVDSALNTLYISDRANNRVRQVNSSTSSVTMYDVPTGLWINTGATGSYYLQGPTTTAANWAADSWTNPLGVPAAFAPISGTSNYTASDGDETINFYPNSGSGYTVISQTVDHTTIGSAPTMPCQDEIPIFLQPNPTGLPGLPGGSSLAPRYTIAGLQHIYHTLTAIPAVHSFPTPAISSESCDTNYPTPTEGMVMTAIVLHNNFTSPPSNFWYQLRLLYYGQGPAVDSNTYPNDFPSDEEWFGSTAPTAFWWHKRVFNPSGPNFKNNFGYSQNVTDYGQPIATIGSSNSYSLDFLPQLASLLESGTNNIDSDLSHWVITGAYFGDSGYGYVDSGGQFSDFSMTAAVNSNVNSSIVPTCKMAAVPASIPLGAVSTVFFTSNGATSGSVDHGLGSTGASGVQSTFTLTPTSTTTYTGTVTGPNGTASCSATVTVTSALTISTVAGNGTGGYTGDGGAATSAELHLPSGSVLDKSGNLYIADTDNNVVRKVSTSGTITTIAGNGTAGYSGDGGAATSAELNQPYGLAMDLSGNLYIADAGNDRIRMVSGGTITTVAGNGTAGYSGDGGAAASATLRVPTGVAVDASGDLFIADTYNNVIREVVGGTITTVAGNGTAGYSGDGGSATSAELHNPYGVAADVYTQGTVYIADTNNNAIRQVTPQGIIKTIAGNGTAGYSGDGGPGTSAELNLPVSVFPNSSDTLYIADSNNAVVRQLSLAGVIRTVAGNGTTGYSGDGSAATSAELHNPYSVTVGGGALYIADRSNNRIRKVPLP